MTPNEVREWLDDLWKILVDLNISINNARRLFESKYKNEEKIKNHGFLQHHWYQLRFIIVIQLAKLISDRKRTHKRNLFFLCDELESTLFDEDFFEELHKLQPERYFESDTTEQSIREVIRLTRKELNDNQEIIDKIIVARDQTYAHNDPISGEKIPAMKDLESMIRACSDIYNRISGEFFKSRTGFEQTGEWNIDYILKELSEKRTELIARLKGKGE